MKVLVVSNFYPPHHIGGYELGCHAVVQRLRLRGHDVRVLTSTFGQPEPKDEDYIYRRLSIIWSGEPYIANSVLRKLHAFRRFLGHDLASRRVMQEACDSFRPDVVYFWNLQGLTSLLVHTAHALGLKTSFFVSDEWLLRWTASDRWLRWCSAVSAQNKYAWLKPLLRLFASALALPTDQPELLNVQFASNYLREATRAGPLAISNAEVIHWGVDLEVFRFCPKAPAATRLLHVGQVVPHKGVDTAIEALHLLRQTDGGFVADLTIAGGLIDPKHEAYLRAMVRGRRLDHAVHFVGVQARAAMVELIAQSDVFVFPYRWREGLSITVLEAMAMGTVVVGTATGGNAELLRDGENALVFPVDDAPALAACLVRLGADPGLFRRLQSAARLTVQRNHNIDQMVNRIEQSLRQTMAGMASEAEYTPERT